MNEFMRQYGWFLTFWGLIALLSALEYLFPQNPEHVDRTHRWGTNFGLGVLNGLIASLTPALTVCSAQWATSRGVGILNWVAAPWWLALPGTLLIRSLAQYAFHRYAHKSSFLWRIHRVHHCDVHLDASSALRFHPLEMIANIAFVVPIIMVCGLSPGILLIYECVEIIVGIMTHTNLRVPNAVEQIASPLLVTPGLHRRHHSADQARADSNYGNVFSFWDRLFGTYCSEPTEKSRTVEVGLEDVSGEQAGDFICQLKLPLRN